MTGIGKDKSRSRASRTPSFVNARYVAVAAFAAAAALSQRSLASVQYWDANASLGGSGIWDAATTADWSSSSSGGASTAVWGSGNDASFSGTAGLVTVSGGVMAHTLTFSTAGYILSGGTITLSGSSPTIRLTTAPGTTSISTTLAGSSGASYAATSSTYTLASSGLNTYTGGTTIAQMTFNFSNLANTLSASSFGSGSDAVAIGGNSTSTTLVNYVGASAATTDRLFQFTGTSASNQLFNNGNGAISFTNSGAAVSGAVSGRTLNFGGTYTGGINSFAETISDLGSGANITALKVASGKWSFTGSNTYTGATTISGGATLIAAANAHALGNTSGIFLSSGTLSLQADANATFGRASDGAAYAITTSAAGAIINADTLTSAGASISKTITVGSIGTSSSSANYSVNFTGANNTSLTVGAITGANPAGTGTVTLSNGITSGTLTIASYTSANGSTTSGVGEMLTITGTGLNTVITNGITAASTGLAAGLSLIKASATSAGTATTLSIQGASSFAGGTTLNNRGTVIIGQTSSLGTGAVTVNQNSTLATTSGLTFQNDISNPTSAITLTLLNSAGAGTTFTAGGLLSGAGNLMLGSTAGTTSLANDNSSFSGTFGTGYGTFSFTSVANSGVVSALGAGTSAYQIGNSTSFAAFRYVGTADSSTNRAISWTANSNIFSLDASGTPATGTTGTVKYLAADAIRPSGTGLATLQLAGSNTGANTLAQIINDPTTGGGTTAVTKVGAGSWTLTGVNSYTGGTTITAGKLVANSTSALGSGVATVNSGILAGNGYTGGSVSVSGTGTITAGSGATSADSVSILHTGTTASVGTTTLTGGSKYAWKIANTTDGAGTGYDRVEVSSLALAGTSTPITITLINASGGTAPTLADGTVFTGILAIDSGTSATDLQADVTAGDFAIDASQFGTYLNSQFILSASSFGSGGSELNVSFTTATPEPATMSLVCITACGLLSRRRRKC